MSDIDGAVHWWLYENCTKSGGASARMRSLLVHFFYCAESLHNNLRKEEAHFAADHRGHMKLMKGGGEGNVFIFNQLSPHDFFQLRGRLALVEDMVCILRQVRKLSANLGNNRLSHLLATHLPKMKKYSYARHYFTHFDERIGANMAKHGVNGELEVPEVGIEFLKGTKGCFYLVFSGDTIYYHDKQRGENAPSPKQLSLGKDGMSDLFSLITDLYDLLTSHSIHATPYPPSKEVYSLD